MGLRGYQAKLSADVIEALNKYRSVLATCPTGGGKTHLISHHAKLAGGLNLIQAHRQELVYQISMALARDGAYHRIIAPDAVCRYIVERQIRDSGRNWVDYRAQTLVASVDTLIARADQFNWLAHINLIQTDEGHHCFPAGTPVMTPYGERPIESIVAGDLVISGSGEPRMITGTFKSPMPDHLIKIQWLHHEITCTSGHPIWTKRGWVRADEITREDFICMHTVRDAFDNDERASALPTQKDWEYFLHDKVRDDLERCQLSSQKTIVTSPMSIMWCADGKTSPYEKLQGLCSKQSTECFVYYDEQDKSAFCVGTNEKEKPDAFGNRSEKSFRNTQIIRSSTKDTRGLRDTFDYGGTCAAKVSADCSNAICNKDGAEMALTLQNRCSISAFKDSNRSRRTVTSDGEKEIIRSKEGFVFNWARVESVQIHKPSDHERNFVYNLTVAVDNTFIVNGALVHNCLPDNKWGRVLNLFPNAKVLAWTATAGRADRKPLAGCFEVLVEGPTVRELLDQGHLCPYRIYGPPPSIDVSAVPESASGDYSPTALRSAAHKSTVTGDMVTHYLKLTPGAVGIAFLVDVDQAKETSERFNAAGIPAVWMSSRETDDRTRVGNLEALARGDLKIICNVDLLGEGVDVPRVEVVLDGRPTKSLPRYLQVFGRLLRNFPGKSIGTYIDLVGNVIEHGLPDAPRVWSLDGGTKRKRLENDEAGLTACLECYWLRPRYKPVCPQCGHRPQPAGRERPEQVDGDLTEYGPELLARLGKAADAIMMPAPDGAAKYVRDNWEVRAMMQTQLRAAMAQWAGTHREVYGRSDSELYRLFWHRFGIDTLTAQSLGRSQAAELHDKIWEDIKNVCTRPRPPAQVIVPDDEVFRMQRAPKGQGGEYQARLMHNGKRINLGYYQTKEEANQVENEYRQKHDLPPKIKIAPKGQGGKHRAHVKYNGKQIYIGYYQTREEKLAAENEYRRKHGLMR